MTTVEIKVRIARTLPREGVYQVDVDIIDAVNIDPALLVFQEGSDTFNHVATVYDLETWPTQPSPNKAFYRGRGAKVFYNELNHALSFETITKDRLNIVAQQWQTIIGGFTRARVTHITVDP